jgi:hypothetical protein
MNDDEFVVEIKSTIAYRTGLRRTFFYACLPDCRMQAKN